MFRELLLSLPPEGTSQADLTEEAVRLGRRAQEDVGLGPWGKALSSGATAAALFMGGAEVEAAGASWERQSDFLLGLPSGEPSGDFEEGGRLVWGGSME